MSAEELSFTNAALVVLEESRSTARKHCNGFLHPTHLALALFKDETALPSRVLKRLGAGTVTDAFAARIAALPKQTPPPTEPAMDDETMLVFVTAKRKRVAMGDEQLAIDHLLLALYESKSVVDILNAAGATRKDIEKTLMEMRKEKKITSEFQDENYEVLNKYATDLCKLAEDGKIDPVIGRADEVRRTIRVLSQGIKKNPVLIGEPGVGKTAIVEGIAQKIVCGDIPDTLTNSRIFYLDMGSFIAGTSHRGEFEERLKSVLNEVRENNDTIILFIDEIHLVLGAGKAGEGSMDAANMLKPMLARGELRIIGATTLQEYRKHVEKDADFESRFMPVYVSEPSNEECISILRGIKKRYETNHGVQITDNAVVFAVKLSSRYIMNRFMPNKAIDLIDKACANVRVQLSSRPEEIDHLERKKRQLKKEANAVSRDKDPASQQRLKAVKADIQRVDEQLQPLLDRYNAGRERVNELQTMQSRLEEKKNKLARAERTGDMSTAADLKDYAIPEIQERIRSLKEQIEAEKSTLVQEKVTESDVAAVVARWTGIPVTKLTQTERDRLLRLAEHLHGRVKGQDEAVERMAEAVLRSRAGLARPHRSTGSFLFLGPTGVGKTELAKAIAEELFDDERHIVRIDMSEYTEQHAVARLLGAPPGYIGHEEGGQLTEPVRRRPHTVVLFDEVEKAHRNVFDVLLQVLDDGRLTDTHGRSVDFSNTIIIMTSNLGSEELIRMSTSKESYEETKERVMRTVGTFFRPEFINRLDDIILFRKFSSKELRGILELAIADLNKRLESQDLSLSLSEDAKDYVLREGFDEEMDARLLRRWIEKNITTAVSRMIIAKEVPPNSTVTICVDSTCSKLLFWCESRSNEFIKQLRGTFS